MNIEIFIILLLASNKLVTSQNSLSSRQGITKSRKLRPFLGFESARINNTEVISGKNDVSSSIDADSANSSNDAESMNNEMEEMNDEPSSQLSNSEDSPKASATVHVPQINFYSSIPNGVGVITNALLWLRELSAALGTPLPIFIGAIPVVVFGFTLMFVPDLSIFNLPLFYPSGAEGDPLAAFPPVPQFAMEDIMDLDAIKNAIKQFFLIPPDWF